jgi:starch phosphorylase
MKATRGYYNPKWQYENVPGLKKAVDRLIDGSFDDKGSGMFKELYNSLLIGTNWQPGDVFYVLGDFEDYRKTRDTMYMDYLDRKSWARKCWINICRSGRFSSDRTIAEYAEDIWKIQPVIIQPDGDA